MHEITHNEVTKKLDDENRILSTLETAVDAISTLQRNFTGYLINKTEFISTTITTLKHIESAVLMAPDTYRHPKHKPVKELIRKLRTLATTEVKLAEAAATYTSRQNDDSLPTSRLHITDQLLEQQHQDVIQLARTNHLLQMDVVLDLTNQLVTNSLELIKIKLDNISGVGRRFHELQTQLLQLIETHRQNENDVLWLKELLFNKHSNMLGSLIEMFNLKPNQSDRHDQAVEYMLSAFNNSDYYESHFFEYRKELVPKLPIPDKIRPLVLAYLNAVLSNDLSSEQMQLLRRVYA